MDISTIVGLCLAVVAIMGSILAGGSIFTFVDVPSVLVVGFGCVGATCMKWPMEILKKSMQITMKTIFTQANDPKEAIEEIGNLAETARRESVFALEKVPIDDPFLKKAMTLAADNRPPEVIQSILQLEIDAMEERHKVGITFYTELAADGPAFGMIGTLIGLILMLQNLSDPSSIGPAMAIALLTTFYGSCLANVLANPFRNKLTIRSKEEMLKMNIVIAGTLGIVAGENPRLIKEKLSAFLPPNLREFEEMGEGD